MPRVPATGRRLSSSVACALAVITVVATASLPTAASAAPPAGGPTGLHDGMMPAGSPDAQQAGVASGMAVAAGTTATPSLGIDVSRWQHPSGATIDWAQVANSGQKFAVVKATELYTDTSGQPVLYTNPYLVSDLTGARAAGLVVGTYAFAHPENSATYQADAFASAIGALPSGSLPPVLDLETSGGLGTADLITWTHTFLDRLQSDTRVQPMIYAGPSFWKTYLGNTSEFAGYPLWEAHYTTASVPASMGGWSTYTLWQFTSTASIPGITGSVDQNRFNPATGASLQSLHAPTGALDSAQTGGAAVVTVSGWALDPDAPTVSSQVQVLVDGVSQIVLAANSRPDVAAVYPLAGDQHGFTATAPVDPGVHTVCASALDTADPSVRTPLGCRTVSLAGSWFYLNDSDTGQANNVFSYGDRGDVVLVANTDGTGGDKLIIRRGNQYFVRNSLTTGPADFSFFYGDPGDTVLIGDWNGDGKDTVAVRRGNVFYIRNSLTSGPADTVVPYGNVGDVVLVGDWNGDGKDSLAVRRGNQYFIKNSLSGGAADQVVTYGDPTDTVLPGRWNGKSTGLAVRRGNTYYLKNTLASGVADTVFSYGNPNDVVLVGDWNGDGVDSLGVRRVF